MNIRLLPTHDVRRVYVGALHLFCFFSTLFYKDYGALHLT
jgi:hypothetical protein